MPEILNRIDSFLIKAKKVYVKSSSKAPKGKVVETGPRGGKFYRIEEYKKGVKRTTPLGLRIPPAWNEVRVPVDKNFYIQAVGLDSKGRKVYLRTDKHEKSSKKDKFKRVRKLYKKAIKIRNKIKKRFDESEEAKVIYLIIKTAFRIGSHADTKATKKAYGATTLQCKHVSVNKNTIKFNFIAKGGIEVKKKISNRLLAKLISERIKNKSSDDEIFKTDNIKVTRYFRKLTHQKFKIHDFRTLIGTELAQEAINKMEIPKTKKQYKQQVKEVARIVAKELGNSPTMALNTYILPEVWILWDTAEIEFKKLYKQSNFNVFEDVFYEDEEEQDLEKSNTDLRNIINSFIEKTEELKGNKFSNKLEEGGDVRENKEPYYFKCEDIYEHIDSILEKGFTLVEGIQPYGAKTIGGRIERNIYLSLRNSVNDWFSEVNRDTSPDKAVLELKGNLLKWQINSQKDTIEDIQKLFEKGIQAGIRKTGILVEEKYYGDINWLMYKSTGISPSIENFQNEVFGNIKKIIQSHYNEKTGIPLYRTARDISSYLKKARNRTELMIKSQVATISNYGMLKAWERDPEKNFFQYAWENPSDNRSKKVSLLRKSGNPYSFSEILFLWKNQEQLINNQWCNDIFNQRCGISRGERLEKEWDNNRFVGKENEFRRTL